MRSIGRMASGIHRGGDQRQQPVQVDHAGNQADHGDHVGNAIDGTGQCLPDRGGVGGEVGCELGGGLAFHAGEVGAGEVGEHPAL